ncbi:hypothetical protein CASFOL_004082 [Castilleja foliolosa]|uniref:Uncharacterized protein n=1 Tax=Castilleja foliolosa TaxID=1961234 RepID=A0ABD3C0F7_9LAMI
MAVSRIELGIHCDNCTKILIQIVVSRKGKKSTTRVFAAVLEIRGI